MVAIQHIVGAAPFAAPLGPSFEQLSILSYNVLLPNSVDGWWNYKMYFPPLTADQQYISTWEYRKDLLRERIAAVDADVVCLQEVSPLSFEEDFSFMAELGYDGKEMFKKGRFRPATFWKSSRCDLASPPVHKDRTLLTAFRTVRSSYDGRLWYVLNTHLQAGREGRRRVRQINEGCRAIMTLARRLKDPDPERNALVVICGDFNGGEECGAVRYLEDGFVDETFLEDGEPVVSGKKELPLERPMKDVMASFTDRPPPGTLVVAELIPTMVEGDAYENPTLSEGVIERLKKVYEKFATHEVDGTKLMNCEDVERWLIEINGEVGRGSEFREAARQMGWKEEDDSDCSDSNKDKRRKIELPKDGFLSLDGFLHLYEKELKQGKFWGIAYDLGALGEPLPDAGVFQARYDRMYCSAATKPIAIRDFVYSDPCPNEREPSDHLPLAACFTSAEA